MRAPRILPIGVKVSKSSSRRSVALVLMLVIVFISVWEPCLTGIALLAQAAGPNEGPYLIDEDTTKVLRVPYLHQDLVGECWLYSAGMVIAYYVGRFEPDRVLDRLGLGFNVGLSIDDHIRLFDVLYEFYNVRLNLVYTSTLLFKRTFTRARDVSIHDVARLVTSEIANGRPLILLVRAYYLTIRDGTVQREYGGHNVVITGYSFRGSELYLVINDPSGWLVRDVLSVTRCDGNTLCVKEIYRVDGSEAYNGRYYHVVVSLPELLQKIEELSFAVVTEHPEPRPPGITVYAFTLRPQARTLIYNVTRSSHHIGITEFYHNNYLERSLWYKIPIVRVGSNLDMSIFVYPNTNRQATFIAIVNVVYTDVRGSTWSERYTFTVKTNGLSNVNLECRGRCSGITLSSPPVNDYATIKINVGSAGRTTVTIEVYDESGSRLEYRWGSFDLYVYDEVISAHHYLLHVYAGVIKSNSEGRKRVDLYFVNSSILIPVLIQKIPLIEIPIEIRQPCTCTLHIKPPTLSPERGGYYRTCSVEVGSDVDRLTIVGRIGLDLRVFGLDLRIFDLKPEFVLHIDLSPAPSAHLKLNQVEFRLTDQETVLAAELCSYVTGTDAIDLNLKAHVSDINGIVDVRIIRTYCGPLELKAAGVPASPLVSTKLTLYDSVGVELYSLVRQVVNPRHFEIANSNIPSRAIPGSFAYVSYALSIPVIPGLRLHLLGISNLVTLNGTKIPSTSWIEDISYDPARNVYSLHVKTAFRTPSLEGSSSQSPVKYEVKVYPQLLYDQVLSYSPDVHVSGTMTIESARPEVSNIAYVLVIDVSGSMGSTFRGKSKLDWAKEASLTLLDLTMDGDLVGVVIFSSAPSILQEIVEVNPDTRPKIASKIAAVWAGGATNIGDSLKLATDMLRKYVAAGYKSIIILLTDGIHNTGTHPDIVLSYVRDSGVKVFTIGLGEPGDIDEEVLRRIADSTGGAYYYAPTPDLLKEIFLLVRGVGLVMNQIESLTTTLLPFETVTREYALGLSEGDHLLEIGWDAGNEPEVYLSLLSVTVDRRNASALGISVSYPVSNTVRFMIPRNLSLVATAVGEYGYGGVSLNLSIRNVNPFDTTLKVELFGGREELLQLTLDNPAGRYSSGQTIHYRIAAEEGSFATVRLEDSAGNVYHYATHVLPHGYLCAGLEGVIETPAKPGVYYIKAQLYVKGILRKTVTSPVIVSEAKYAEPLSVSVARTIVRGFGEISVPLTIRVQDSGVLNREVLLAAKLDSSALVTSQPDVYVEPAVLKLTRGEEGATLRIKVPMGTTPGRYNLSLVVKVRGHSTMVLEDLVALVVPNITISLRDFGDVTLLHEGDSASIVGTLDATGDSSYTLSVKIKPFFSENIVFVNGSREYEAHLSTNFTTKVTLQVSPKRVGIFQGRLSVYANDTLIFSKRQVVIVAPPDVNLSKLVWGVGFGFLSVGPEGEIHAKVAINGTVFSASFIGVPKSPISRYDYFVYVSREPKSARPSLVLFLGDAASQFEGVVVEEYGGTVSRYRVDPSERVLAVELGQGELFRVWLESMLTQTVTITTTLTETITTTHTLTVSHTETVRETETIPLHTTLYVDKYIVREHTHVVTQRQTYTVTGQEGGAIYRASILFLLLVSIASLLTAVLIYKRSSRL